MYKVNTAEGGTNGTTVTAGSGGNSGGGSGDFFDTVQIGASAALVFSNTHPARNALGYRFSTGASAVQCDLQWTISPAVATCWFRIYLFTPSSFSTAPSIVRFQGSGTQAVRIAWNASGNILIRNTANTTVATSTNTMSTSTMYRLEGFCTVGASGTAEIKFWSSVDSSGAPVETLTAASQNYGTNNIDNFSVGQIATLANMPQWWTDDIAVTDVAYLGPSLVPGTAALTGAGTVTALVTQGASASPTGAGTLSAAVVQQATASPTGAGTLTSAVTQGATASPAGAGTLTNSVTQGATLSAAGAGSVTSSVIQGSKCSPVGAGALAVLATQQAIAALTGAGSLSALVTQGANVTLTGAGTLTADSGSSATINGTADMAGAGVLAVLAVQGATVALDGAGVVAAVASGGGGCTTARPFGGITLYPLATTARPDSGATARPMVGATTRPDTGITEDPC